MCQYALDALLQMSRGVVSVSYTHLDVYKRQGNNRVRVLVDEAEHGEDIVEAESKAALERALKMRDEATNQVELEKAHQLVDRHAVRLKVADLHRRKRRM